MIQRLNNEAVITVVFLPNSNTEFYVLIERDEDGIYIGEVPQLRGCYSQGETIDELIENMREVIALCLEE